ncbi:hypothetical protein N7492_005484 [Penicillium capsulatum]|uniref:Ran-interacting protein Mog1 n=1 Tax=Penicillium capsulatum TaxID=69766 RepID=A0A9W9ICJ9_9EURO|nr:hypothetical protein N7492_005484 [Penicillium capsulatum]KAJ6135415.1 hypothetical protein N7512_000575 [Penicillium capsulatum]
MVQVQEQDFFGGAMRGVVPQRWLDASDVREIPDHQEVWLSPETLSTQIVEINQRVSKEEALSTFSTLSHQQPALAAGSGSAAHATAETVDQAAALYHLHDLCDEGDALQIVTPPQRVTPTRLVAAAPSGSTISAYKGVVTYITATKRGGSVPGASDHGTVSSVSDSAVAGATLSGETSDLPPTTKVTCHYLLMRLGAQETDLVVFFNVPHEEFDKSGNPRGLSKEEAIAEDTISALVEKFEIRDWELFV